MTRAIYTHSANVNHLVYLSVCVSNPRPFPCLSTCLHAFLNDLVTIQKLVSASSILSGCLQSFLTHYQPTLFFYLTRFSSFLFPAIFYFHFRFCLLTIFFLFFASENLLFYVVLAFLFCFLFHYFARVAFLPAFFFFFTFLLGLCPIHLVPISPHPANFFPPDIYSFSASAFCFVFALFFLLSLLNNTPPPSRN